MILAISKCTKSKLSDIASDIACYIAYFELQVQVEMHNAISQRYSTLYLIAISLCDIACNIVLLRYSIHWCWRLQLEVEKHAIKKLSHLPAHRRYPGPQPQAGLTLNLRRNDGPPAGVKVFIAAATGKLIPCRPRRTVTVTRIRVKFSFGPMIMTIDSESDGRTGNWTWALVTLAPGGAGLHCGQPEPEAAPGRLPVLPWSRRRWLSLRLRARAAGDPPVGPGRATGRRGGSATRPGLSEASRGGPGRSRTARIQGSETRWSSRSWGGL